MHLLIQRARVRSHTPALTLTCINELMQDGTLILLDWPSQSLDFNPIENLWSHFEYMIGERLISSKPMMMEVINKAWDVSKDEELLHTLIESIPRRIQAVIEAERANKVLL